MKPSTVVNGTETTSAARAVSTADRTWEGLTRDDLVRAYRTMLLSRRLDDKEIQLKNQSLIFFQISGAGHEAVLIAAGMHLRPGYDWFYPVLSRPRALPHARHDAARDAARRGRGRKTIPIPAAARCRRTGAIETLNIPSQGSPTGTQCLQAVGVAEAGAHLHARGGHSRSRGTRRTPTKSPTCRSAKARRAKASSGSRSTPPAPARRPVLYLDRRQRLRHLGPGRSADARRRHFASR